MQALKNNVFVVERLQSGMKRKNELLRVAAIEDNNRAAHNFVAHFVECAPDKFFIINHLNLTKL